MFTLVFGYLKRRRTDSRVEWGVSRNGRGTITWGEIGCPTEARTVTVREMTFRIENRHIEAAEGEPEATFLIIEAATVSDGKHYTLGIRLD